MYSEKDLIEINGKIKKNIRVWAPILLVLAAVYAAALIIRIKWLVYAAAVLLCIAACYGILAYLIPNTRYRRFLMDMEEGLSREIRGRIVEISDQEDMQDGVRVLPVRIYLEDEQDERIVYLNASKKAMFPDAGENVILHCYGRHIRNAEKA